MIYFLIESFKSSFSLFRPRQFLFFTNENLIKNHKFTTIVNKYFHFQFKSLDRVPISSTKCVHYCTNYFTLKDTLFCQPLPKFEKIVKIKYKDNLHKQ